MAQLIVRNIEDTLVRALKVRAARHGRSAEAEHRRDPAGSAGGDASTTVVSRAAGGHAGRRRGPRLPASAGSSTRHRLMAWLVDTNVLSELRKGDRCHPSVRAWFTSVEDGDLFTSVLVDR